MATARSGSPIRLVSPAIPTHCAPSAADLRKLKKLKAKRRDLADWRREFPAAPFPVTDTFQASLLRQLGGHIPPIPCGFNVLLAIFVRPKQMQIKGGGGKVIWLPDNALTEDVYQGRVGLVLAIGSTAYADDKVREFGGAPWVQPGDWAIYPALENAASRFTYAGITWTGVNDDKITAVVENPLLVT